MTDQQEQPVLIIYSSGRYELLQRVTISQMQNILAAIARDVGQMAIGPSAPPTPPKVEAE